MVGYTPTYPEPPQASPAAVAAVRPFDTQAALGYSLRTLQVSFQEPAVGRDATIGGVADNVLTVQGQFRAGDWLIGGSVWRFKAPLTASVLSAVANPALNPEISEIRARAGYVLGFAARAVGGVPVAFEAAPGLALLAQQSEPGGIGLPLTGTPLDFAQTRRGLGLELPLAIGLGDRAEARAQGAIFPFAGGRLTRAPYAFHDHTLHMLEFSLGLKVRLVGGLDAELTASVENWLGAVKLGNDMAEFRDLSAGLTVGLVYRPERVGR